MHARYPVLVHKLHGGDISQLLKLRTHERPTAVQLSCQPPGRARQLPAGPVVKS